ncbi:MAG: hypothetical protein NTV32_05160 [Gammaproteobacteria bacterium]|jgi:trans-aconitate methyltransferase|nr:hypothetical protein [Gammaproteobacteria bacterium]
MTDIWNAKTNVDAVFKEYPLQKNGKVLLPFRRLFMVAGVA